MKVYGESEILSFFLGITIGVCGMYAARTVRFERHPLSGGRGVLREVTIGPVPTDFKATIDNRNEPRAMTRKFDQSKCGRFNEKLQAVCDGKIVQFHDGLNPIVLDGVIMDTR